MTALALPKDLPNVANAKLPAMYEAAKSALTKCEQIDECQDWGDKMAALASYAKQADDDSLQKCAVRIQARAIRRCGELLQQIEPAKGGDRGGGRPSADGNQRDGTDPLVSRKSAATEAGLSERQRKTALRVAAIDAAEFEAAVESENPPTVTALVERGIVKQTSPAHPTVPSVEPKPLFDLKGRDPRDFQATTEVLGNVRLLADVAGRVSPDVVLRGASPIERQRLTDQLTVIVQWAAELLDGLLKEKP